MGVLGVYIGTLRNMEKGNKRNPQPTNLHLHPNQVKKTINELGLSIIYKYVQDKKLQRSENFLLWIENNEGNVVPLPPNSLKNHNQAYHPSFFSFFFPQKNCTIKGESLVVSSSSLREHLSVWEALTFYPTEKERFSSY